MSAIDRAVARLRERADDIDARHEAQMTKAKAWLAEARAKLLASYPTRFRVVGLQADSDSPLFEGGIGGFALGRMTQELAAIQAAHRECGAARQRIAELIETYRREEFRAVVLRDAARVVQEFQ